MYDQTASLIKIFNFHSNEPYLQQRAFNRSIDMKCNQTHLYEIEDALDT